MEGNWSDAGVSEHYVHVPALITVYVLVCIVGVIGNVSLMLALSSVGASRLRTPQLVSACAADLLVCLVSAPLAAARASGGQPLSCQIAEYFEALPVAASTLSIMAIAADRYGTVRRGRAAPLCAKPVLVVVAVWSAAIALGACSTVARCWGCSTLTAAHALLTYGVPVTGVFRCHWAVHSKLTALSLTARAAHGELPLPVPLMRRPTHVIIVAGVGPRERRDAVDVGDVRSRKLQPSLLGPQPQTSTLRSRRRLGNVLLAIAGVFALCWGPYCVIVLVGALGGRVPASAARWALLAGHTHSALAAVAYWALNRHALTSACAAWRLPQLRTREERPSSTNEAALGAFHPRLAKPAPSPRPPPSSFLY